MFHRFEANEWYFAYNFRSWDHWANERKESRCLSAPNLQEALSKLDLILRDERKWRTRTIMVEYCHHPVSTRELMQVTLHNQEK